MAFWLLYCIVGHPNPASAPSILLVLLEAQSGNETGMQTMPYLKRASHFLEVNFACDAIRVVLFSYHYFVKTKWNVSKMYFSENVKTRKLSP